MFILILCETYSGHEQIDENLVRTPNVYQITSPSSARLYIPSEQTIFTPPLYEQTTRVFFDRFFFNLMFILWFVDDFFSKSFSSHGIHGIIWGCKCFGSRWMVLVGSESPLQRNVDRGVRTHVQNGGRSDICRGFRRLIPGRSCFECEGFFLLRRLVCVRLAGWIFLKRRISYEMFFWPTVRERSFCKILCVCAPCLRSSVCLRSSTINMFYMSITNISIRVSALPVCAFLRVCAPLCVSSLSLSLLSSPLSSLLSSLLSLSLSLLALFSSLLFFRNLRSPEPLSAIAFLPHNKRVQCTICFTRSGGNDSTDREGLSCHVSVPVTIYRSGPGRA